MEDSNISKGFIMSLKRLLQITGFIGFIFTTLQGMESIEKTNHPLECPHASTCHGHNQEIHMLARKCHTRPQEFISFDGGGIRGLYSLYIVKAIEAKLNAPITKHCNLFTGTSTGGIIAMGYAFGKTTDELIDLYTTHAKDIFYRSYRHMFESGCGLINEKYNTAPLENLLKKFLGETTTLKDLTNANIIIPATNITKDTAIFFNSYLAKIDDRHNELLWKILRCTTAAPTYFEPMELHGDAIVDGGLVANNPSLLSGIEIDGIFGHGISNNFDVISIGTGRFNRGITYEYAKSMGVLKWASPISSTIMDSCSETYNQLASAHYRPEKYVRLNGDLTQEIPLDGTSQAELDVIKKNAENYIATHQEEIDKAVKLLLQ